MRLLHQVVLEFEGNSQSTTPPINTKPNESGIGLFAAVLFTMGGKSSPTSHSCEAQIWYQQMTNEEETAEREGEELLTSPTNYPPGVLGNTGYERSNVIAFVGAKSSYLSYPSMLMGLVIFGRPALLHSRRSALCSALLVPSHRRQHRGCKTNAKGSSRARSNC